MVGHQPEEFSVTTGKQTSGALRWTLGFFILLIWGGLTAYIGYLSAQTIFTKAVIDDLGEIGVAVEEMDDGEEDETVITQVNSELFTLEYGPGESVEISYYDSIIYADDSQKSECDLFLPGVGDLQSRARENIHSGVGDPVSGTTLWEDINALDEEVDADGGFISHLCATSFGDIATVQYRDKNTGDADFYIFNSVTGTDPIFINRFEGQVISNNTMFFVEDHGLYYIAVAAGDAGIETWKVYTFEPDAVYTIDLLESCTSVTTNDHLSTVKLRCSKFDKITITNK